MSAGNHFQPFTLSVSRNEYERIDDEQAVQLALHAMWQDAANRRLLSPAESLNAVTVGAAHADAGGAYTRGQRIDLLRNRVLCSPISTVSGGYRRAVKPDILMPGGRQLYSLQYQISDHATLACSAGTAPPGQRLAVPGSRPGELSRFVHQRGSSNAAALATRLAAQLYDRLLELRQQPGDERITDESMVVLVKALLVHSALWRGPRAIERLLDDTFKMRRDNEWQRRREITARFVGFGNVDPRRVLSSDDYRVVLLGSSAIEKDQSHVYEIPIPASLNAMTVRRRIVATLAWLSPLNPRHHRYRRANLYLTVNGNKHDLFDTTTDANETLAGRGTVQHLVYESDRRVVIAEDDILTVRVSCAEEAGELVHTVPYGLAITMEVDPAAEIPIYAQIRDRIQLRIRVRSS
ncbi:MAG: S8 family serine peptidase [Proteobacteria bacterium]|nr:S8 family serine peptidase [Pseudomonadota bacterium]